MARADKGSSRGDHQALFGSGRQPGAAALVTVAAGERKLSADEQTFNRLTERIRRGREVLASWEAYIARFQRRVAAELEPIERGIRDAMRRLAQQLDALLAAPKEDRLSRRHRGRVRSLLLAVVEDLLAQGPDPELEALHDRHSEVSHADLRQRDVALAEDLLGEVFGSELVQGHDARDVEELLRHASEKFESRQANRDEAPAVRGRRASRAAERKAQAAREASLSVRDIYRKLASALHPDREADPIERERKTALMQRVNQAYERNDLLELLTLQIEIEQIDARSLASVPAARLRHYNQVLLEQARALDAQLGESIAVFRVEFGLSAREVTPQRVDRALTARIAEARAHLRDAERDLQSLADPRRRRAFLDALPEPGFDAADADVLVALARTLNVTAPAARPAGRRGKRRRR